MTNAPGYTIELIKITPVNIKPKDFKTIERKISEVADDPKNGETEIDVFKEFASRLETEFEAQISTFNPPSEEFKHWMLYLPKDGNFDATSAWFSISFHIKRNENL